MATACGVAAPSGFPLVARARESAPSNIDRVVKSEHTLTFRHD